MVRPIPGSCPRNHRHGPWRNRLDPDGNLGDAEGGREGSKHAGPTFTTQPAGPAGKRAFGFESIPDKVPRAERGRTGLPSRGQTSSRARGGTGRHADTPILGTTRTRAHTGRRRLKHCRPSDVHGSRQEGSVRTPVSQWRSSVSHGSDFVSRRGTGRGFPARQNEVE